MKNSFYQPTLLIVTDQMDIRSWIRSKLSKEFTIVEAKTSGSAIQTALSTLLNFIIVDERIKYGDVFELCSELKRITFLNWTPILLITGKLKKTYREKALKFGVTDFLSSDLDDEELTTRIATLKKIRETQNLVYNISSTLSKTRQQTASISLKDKFLLNDEAMRFMKNLQEEKKSLSVLLIQIDCLDALEKKWDISSLQEAVILFSKAIKKFVRKTDVVLPSTFGKFILFLPEFSYEKAVEFSHTLKKHLEKNPFTSTKGDISLTVSIALNYLDKNSSMPMEKQFSQFMDRASTNLKKLKAKGGKIIYINKKGVE